MMNKGISKFIITTLSILLLVCPFHIYADDYTTYTIVGVNTVLIDESNYISPGSNEVHSTFVYESTFLLDNYYKGDINMTLRFNWGQITETTKTINVNGNTFKVNFYINSVGTYSSQEKPTFYSLNYTVNSHNLVLQHLNNNMWDYPIESYPWINTLMSYGYQPTNFTPYNNYQMPTFELTDKQIYYGWIFANRDYYMSFYLDGSIIMSNIDSIFDFGTMTVKEIKDLNPYMNLQLYTLVLRSSSTAGGNTIRIKGTHKIMPLYFGYNTDILSTDFALQIGVQNRLLYDIESLQSGTQSSNESAAENNSSNDDLASASGSLFNQEDSFNNSMNSSLQNIDTNNGLNAMGSKFSSSANWVRIQFNRLTDNTPFGSVLSFSLILGLALLLIGRWRHD